MFDLLPKIQYELDLYSSSYLDKNYRRSKVNLLLDLLRASTEYSLNNKELPNRKNVEKGTFESIGNEFNKLTNKNMFEVENIDQSRLPLKFNENETKELQIFINLKNSTSRIFICFKEKTDRLSFHVLNEKLVPINVSGYELKLPIKSVILTELQSHLNSSEKLQVERYGLQKINPVESNTYYSSSSYDIPFSEVRDIYHILLIIIFLLNNLNIAADLTDSFLKNKDFKELIYFDEMGNIEATKNDMKDLGFNKLWEDEELNQLVFTLKETDKKNRDVFALIAAHMHYPLTRKFFSPGLSADEEKMLRQNVLKNLINAVYKYQIGQSKFSTYGYNWVLQAFQRSNQQIIRNRIKDKYGVSVSYHKVFVEFYKLKELNSKNPTIEEQVKNLEEFAAEKKKEKINKKKRLEMEKHKRSGLYLLYGQIANKHLTKKDVTLTKKLLSELAGLCLHERELHIIKERYLKNAKDPRITLQVVGDQLKVTRERIRQLEDTAIKKLQVAFQKNNTTRKIAKEWFEPIVQDSRKSGLTLKLRKALIQNNLFFVGQIQDMGIEKFIQFSISVDISEKNAISYFYEITKPKYEKAFKNNLHIEALNLSERSTNALKKHGCNFVNDVDLSQLNYIPNIGASSKKEIIELFQRYK